MSATLGLRVNKWLGGTSTSEGAVANVYGLSEAGARDPSRDQRSLVIPAGAGATPLTIQLEPGAYVVEAVLPSGDIATDQVRIAEGKSITLDLEPPGSPHEWLSWQQYIGNVPARPEKRRATRTPRADPERHRARTQVERIDRYARGHRYMARAGFSMDRLLSVEGGGGGYGAADDGGHGGGRGGGYDTIGYAGAVAELERPRPRAPRLPARPAVWFLADPVDSLRGGELHGAEAWSLLAHRSTAKDPIGALARGRPTRAPVPRNSRDPDREVHFFGVDGPTVDERRDQGRGPETPRRYLLSIQTGGAVELASLPVPWDSGGAGRVPVEVLVRRHPLEGEAMLAMSPADPNTRTAIGYMGSGGLVNARLMFEQAKGLLFGKRINPLAAAAGGYVLLATEHGPGDEDWYGWIKNLADGFEWVPDGMIQYGRLRLNHRTGDKDVEAARAAFFTAYDRGLPFYSLGLQWLVEGLSLLATRDDESKKRLAKVQEVTWRANLQQPFTTIRLRDR